jgi:hypothetical protein
MKFLSHADLRARGINFSRQAGAEVCVLATCGNPKRVSRGVRQLITSNAWSVRAEGHSSNFLPARLGGAGRPGATSWACSAMAGFTLTPPSIRTKRRRRRAMPPDPTKERKATMTDLNAVPRASNAPPKPSIAVNDHSTIRHSGLLSCDCGQQEQAGDIQELPNGDTISICRGCHKSLWSIERR